MLKPKKSIFHKNVDYRNCSAKTFVRPDGVIVTGRTVFNHCLIVGSVARALVKRFPIFLQEKIFPANAHFASSAHDIGKTSPTFQEKLGRKCLGGIPGVELNSAIEPTLESIWGGHAGVSQVSADAMNAPKYVPQILGQHHGFSPDVASYTADSDVFGGSLWQEQRSLLVEALKASLDADWPIILDDVQAKTVAGLTTVSDWIGSGHHFEDPSLPWESNIEKALDDAGMIPPHYSLNLGFKEIFGFEPREEQSVLIDAVKGPGVYVLEGQMGIGKTEAALYAAYKILGAGMASGIYFALPTQLTSNKIYDRFNQFLNKILTGNVSHRAMLLHGTAHLLEEADLGEDACPGGSWFDQSKRGLLAPFAVGTLDQALMSVMNVRHGFVRAFGLAGKVVILDEVHTYDAYTGTILDSLVKTLRQLHCTVIILSATLSQEKREKMLGCEMKKNGYPLITACPMDEVTQEIAIESETTHRVQINLIPSEKDALDEALSRASEGQQVLWIENTVKEAQERYLDISIHAKTCGIEIGLIHSKYTQDHRSKRESEWVNTFGKPGWKNRSATGRILIGTQVLEQSIDIDADFLVSKFCPTDMILQRIGRLWRHEKTPRHPSATCEAWLIAPSLDAAIEIPEKAFGSSAFVYSPFVLCRALEIWDQTKTVVLPGDIRGLIERSYAIRDEQGLMKKWLEQLEKGNRKKLGREALGQLAMLSLATNGTTYCDEKPQTRYSDEETVDVLLLSGFNQKQNAIAATIKFMDASDSALPVHAKSLSKQQLRKLSSKIMRQVVKCRPHEAPKPVSMSVLRQSGINHCLYLGQPDADTSIVRVAIVDDQGTISSLSGGSANDDFELSYRNDLGYRAKKG